MPIVLLSSTERHVAKARWEKLEQQIGNTTLKNSWFWIGTWLNHFGNAIPHTFAFGTRDGQTIGAALITRPRLLPRFPLIPIVYLGTAGEPHNERTHIHYNRLLVARNNLEPFSESLMRWLAQLRWSILRLDGFVPEHAEALMKAGRNMGIPFEV